MFQRVLPACLLSLLSISLLASADEQPKGKESDKEKTARGEAALRELVKFQGTWLIESQEMNGKPVPAVDLKSRTLFFGGELFILRKGDEVLQIGIQKIDPAKSVPTVNATISKGLYQGETMLGIYQFDGEKLRVCFEIEGQNRPTEFKTGSGEGRYIAVYKRVPAATDESADIVGKYESSSTDLDGKEHKADAEISRQGDAYLVRYTKGQALAYLGIGMRRGNTFAVTWANRGEVGLSMYRIEKDGRLVGEYTQLGAIGIVNRENLTPKRAETATKAEKK